MHTRRKNQPETLTGSRNCHRAGTAPLLGLLLFGCASPGPPLPPSLNLPEIAANVTAVRSGDEVRLHWTTASRTTDRMPVRGPVTAAICRHVISPGATADLQARGPIHSSSFSCNAVTRVAVTPGDSEAVDTLPQALRSGQPQLLAYRVELLNQHGRTAGVSAPVFIASGSSPDQVDELQAKPTKAGVVLEWGKNDFSASDEVEITRRITSPKPPRSSQTPGMPEINSTPAEARFSVSPDVGGTIDHSAAIGQDYAYTAKRVRTVRLGPETLQVQSATSAPVTVEFRDIFPPETPAGLVAVPGFSGPGANSHPAIDLSWDPDLEPRLAGYRVYRRDSTDGAWHLLTPELVRTPAFSDTTVQAERSYFYRVAAVSDAGMESPPSTEISETAPSPQ